MISLFRKILHKEESLPGSNEELTKQAIEKLREDPNVDYRHTAMKLAVQGRIKSEK